LQPNVAHIFTGNFWAKKAKPIIVDESINIEGQWHPALNAIVFSSNRTNKKTFDVFYFDITNNCLKQLTTNPANDRHPHLVSGWEKPYLY
jgi:Tol biopolymer transport system component